MKKVKIEGEEEPSFNGIIKTETAPATTWAVATVTATGMAAVDVAVAPATVPLLVDVRGGGGREDPTVTALLPCEGEMMSPAVSTSKDIEENVGTKTFDESKAELDSMLKAFAKKVAEVQSKIMENEALIEENPKLKDVIVGLIDVIVGLISERNMLWGVIIPLLKNKMDIASRK